MEIESVRCECCGLKEDCTHDYISEVKSDFQGKWLCGLCAEAVRDELVKGRKKGGGVEEAVKAHMAFCGKFKSNPAVRVADGMRRCSGGGPVTCRGPPQVRWCPPTSLVGLPPRLK